MEKIAATGYATFNTAIGTCAVAWRDDTIVGFSLPALNDQALVKRFEARHPGAERLVPSPAVATAIRRTTRHLAGELDDFGDLDVQPQVPEFERRVYALTRAIAPGSTRSYGELATELGDPTLARAVGQAMAHNPVPLLVPCHRVLSSDGSLHGFSAPGGLDTKRRLLLIEGAAAVAQGSLFDSV